jgi:predicted PurR-regulated permease PerM
MFFLFLAAVWFSAAIQLAEGYLLQPLVERKTVNLPPAMTISMQVMLGAVFGLAGVALATPLTAVLAVLVSMLYVQDVLGDPVKTPSEL